MGRLPSLAASSRADDSLAGEALPGEIVLSRSYHQNRAFVEVGGRLLEGEKPSILRIARQPVSLEIPVGDDADATLGDMIEDVSASSLTEAAIHANMRAAIDEALDELSPREAKVLRMRFGPIRPLTTRSKRSASSST